MARAGLLRRARKAITRRAPRRQVARVAFVAGLILLLAGATGNAVFYVYLLHLVAPYFPADLVPLLGFTAGILVLLASLGGITVILGAWLLSKGKRLPGKFAVSLGAGSSLLGLIVQLVLVAYQGGNPLQVAQHALSGLTAVALVMCFWVELKG
ncbi:MAG TPA: hypothetical protein VNZ52_14830 [Candidatus Thermoplasmatota archaeon]|nr:hypothetical protein [Candidatus Thermoplasmatota archaeon]